MMRSTPNAAGSRQKGKLLEVVARRPIRAQIRKAIRYLLVLRVVPHGRRATLTGNHANPTATVTLVAGVKRPHRSVCLLGQKVLST
jgi:hypothetical protein